MVPLKSAEVWSFDFGLRVGITENADRVALLIHCGLNCFQHQLFVTQNLAEVLPHHTSVLNDHFGTGE